MLEIETTASAASLDMLQAFARSPAPASVISCYDLGMRIHAAVLALAACGGPTPKKESSLVEGDNTPATCCCKTIPQTAEKEIIPNYTMEGRMECSTNNGQCVPDVQCNGSQQQPTPPNDTGVPPPPPLQKDTGVPPPPPIRP
jgi:hypothetical protein